MLRVRQGLDESTEHVDVLWLRARPAKNIAYARRERRARHILVDLGDRVADALENGVVRWRNLHLSGLAARRLENQPVRAGQGSPHVEDCGRAAWRHAATRVERTPQCGVLFVSPRIRSLTSCRRP